MKVCYDKLLINKKMNKTDLIREAKISSNVLAKMGKENLYSWKLSESYSPYLAVVLMIF